MVNNADEVLKELLKNPKNKQEWDLYQILPRRIQSNMLTLCGERDLILIHRNFISYKNGIEQIYLW